MLIQLGLLAHCGAKWYLCDTATGIGAVGFLAFMVVGLKRLERRAEARTEELRRARGYAAKGDGPRRSS